MSTHPRSSAKEKQRRYRNRLRSQGLRPVQIWVPDSKIPGFAEQCRRQCRRIRRASGERETLGFIEAIADWDET